jgi:hypothetical protein
MNIIRFIIVLSRPYLLGRLLMCYKYAEPAAQKVQQTKNYPNKIFSLITLNS